MKEIIKIVWCTDNEKDKLEKEAEQLGCSIIWRQDYSLHPSYSWLQGTMIRSVDEDDKK